MVPMRYIRSVFGFGVWIFVLPFLGFPTVWKTVLFALSGVGLCYLSFLMYKREMPHRILNKEENVEKNGTS